MSDDAKAAAKARRRAIGKLLQKVQHAVPGFVLVQHGVAALRESAHGWHVALAVAEVATSAAVFVSFVLAVKTLREQLKDRGVPHPHYGVDWIDIFLAAMLATESWSKWMIDGRMWRPTSLLAIVMLLLGIFGGRIAKWKFAQHHEGPVVVALARKALRDRAPNSRND